MLGAKQQHDDAMVEDVRLCDRPLCLVAVNKYPIVQKLLTDGLDRLDLLYRRLGVALVLDTDKLHAVCKARSQQRGGGRSAACCELNRSL